jgi:hypothetical protein
LKISYLAIQFMVREKREKKEEREKGEIVEEELKR